MKNVFWISGVSFLLIGSAYAFRIWALQEFAAALDQMTGNGTQKSLLASVGIAGQDMGSASTTLAVSSDSSAPKQLTFMFPSDGDTLYEGCAYPVTWESSTTLTAIGLKIRDAHALQAVSPAVAGLPTNATTTNSTLQWRVGTVRPGTYYLEITSANGLEYQQRGPSIELAEPAQDAQLDVLCKKTGGTIPQE